MNEYRYFQGSQGASEAVEFDVRNRAGGYKTTCSVAVRLLTSGIKAFPCGDGDDVKLDDAQRLEILKFVENKRNGIRNRYPVKTYKGWGESGFGTIEDYIAPGEETDEEMVDYFINVLPPHIMRSDLVQDGEPHGMALDPETGKTRTTFITLSKTGGKWYFSGYCFSGRTENREHDFRALDGMIKKLEAGKH